jgi:uncharacterized protein (TIGR00266 family)
MPPRKSLKTAGGTPTITILKDTLKFTLTAGQSVLTAPGSMIYMDGNIEKGEVKLGGFGKAFGRLFAGEDFFMTKYSGKASVPGKVALSLPFPGDILQINMKAGESYRVSRGCFLACTENITLSGTAKPIGILELGQEEGFVLPLFTCSEKEGTLWLGGYGNFEEHKLEKGEIMYVDNGIFLACKNEMNYELEKLGKSLWSSFMGGEGIGMKFTGPGVLYTQSKNFNDLIQEISRKLPTENSAKQKAVAGILDSVLGSDEGGGRKQKAKKNRA